MKENKQNQSDQRREVAEENADTARLDWLEKHRHSVLSFTIFDREGKMRIGSEWEINEHKTIGTIREAIDAARGAEKADLGDETQTARELSSAETGLAPCPFCGGEAQDFSTQDTEWVECRSCGAGTHVVAFSNGAKSYELWNQRAPLTAQGEAKRGIQAMLTAAKNMDWYQVVLNGGPPCFHIQEDGYFCGRTERWGGHLAPSPIHRFVSLSDLIEGIAR